jgi:hypothetical protein
LIVLDEADLTALRDIVDAFLASGNFLLNPG